MKSDSTAERERETLGRGNKRERYIVREREGQVCEDEEITESELRGLLVSCPPWFCRSRPTPVWLSDPGPCLWQSGVAEVMVSWPPTPPVA